MQQHFFEHNGRRILAFPTGYEIDGAKRVSVVDVKDYDASNGIWIAARQAIQALDRGEFAG